MTVLLAGCGYWGKNWANCLSNLNELGAICEPETALHQDLKQAYPGTPVYADLNEALRHPGIDAVVLATPVATHFQLAAACLKAGFPVLAEKPLTLDPKEAHDLAALAKKQRRVLAVGHLLLYHPGVVVIKAMIGRGELGDVLAVQCTRVNLGKIRNEESVWWSLAPHDLSVISYLLDEPLSVTTADKFNLLKRQAIEDAVSVTLETPSGKRGKIDVSWLSPYKKHETIVTGTQKIVVLNDTLPPGQKLSVYDYALERHGESVENVVKSEVQYVALDISRDPLTQQAEAFLASVRNGTPLCNDAENAVRVVELLDDVQRRLNRKNSRKALAAV